MKNTKPRFVLLAELVGSPSNRCRLHLFEQKPCGVSDRPEGWLVNDAALLTRSCIEVPDCPPTGVAGRFVLCAIILLVSLALRSRLFAQEPNHRRKSIPGEPACVGSPGTPIIFASNWSSSRSGDESSDTACTSIGHFGRSVWSRSQCAATAPRGPRGQGVEMERARSVRRARL